MQDYIGEDKVNKAMRNFLEAHKYKTPYPTSLDFLSYLEPQVPDSLSYLIDDWFKEITLYDNRLNSATYEKKDDNKYKVTFYIESYKIKADTLGVETITTINDWVDIGLFSDEAGEDLEFIKRIKLNQPNTTYTVEVDFKPVKAAVDPKQLLIDKSYEDNVVLLKGDVAG